MSEYFNKMMIYLTPLIIIIMAVILGWIFKTYVHRRLKLFAKKTKWEGDDVFLGAIESASFLWFILVGVYIALNYTPLSNDLVGTIRIIVFAFIILSVTLTLSRIAVGMLELYAKKTDGALPSTTMLTNLTRIIIVVIGLLVIFQTLGVSITPVLTALGIGGLAISLALKDTLSDLFAGLHIILSKKMKPGDLVELDSGQRGTVENIAWRNTTLRDRTNNLIIVPNSKLSSATMVNYDVPVKELIVRVSCGVSYDSDLDHVERVTLEVAKQIMDEVEGGVPESQPMVTFINFGESSIDFRISMRAKDYSGQYAVTHALIKRLHKRYKKEGIEIPFPIRTIYQAK